MGAYSKLKLKISSDVKEITFNEITIKIKQYLPVEDKLEMIGKIISGAADDNQFYNVGKLDIFLNLQLLYNYTDLNFKDDEKEKVTELYDEVIASGLMENIKQYIPESELSWINRVLDDTVKSIYQYQNSILGIADTLGRDYSNLGIEAPKIQEALKDPENLKLVKDILTKLG